VPGPALEKAEDSLLREELKEMELRQRPPVPEGMDEEAVNREFGTPKEAPERI
jgi:hypothetical protein